MTSKLEALKALLGEIADLNHAAALLGWDQQTYMPAGAAESRGHQLATLGKLAHQKFTADEVGKLIEAAQAELADADPDSDEARLVKVTAKDYDKATRVPSDFVARMSMAQAAAHEGWVAARSKSDFSIFRPHLEKLLELGREYIGYFPPSDHPYDILLDGYEPGMKTSDVQAIFEALRPQQVALLEAIAAAPQVDDAFLHQAFDEKKQWHFGVEVITQFGYDWQRGRQDKSPHPFTTNFSINDVRITTRFMKDFLPAALFGTMHEAGHAMYEQGIKQAYERTPLASGASLAIHESQSRLWENLVGRSLPFWEHFYPRLQEYFPSQLGNVDLPTFYRGINKVSPSLIRVEADEATYNLHIMLRMELEIAMVEGSLDIKDLPEIWNAKMQEYLGITPSKDAEGVLQDIHWSMGLMGYFSTYALGNLISAQWWQEIRRAVPNLDEEIRAGKFANLLGWLRENIHQHGRKYEPQELVQRVTGQKITAEPYMTYLKEKYGAIYAL